MKSCKTILTVGLALYSVVCGLSAHAYDFSRYQVIIDRKPFGDAPVAPPVAPTTNINPNAPDWLKDYRLTMLTEETDGTLTLGLVNNKTKASVVLSEGEENPIEGIRFLSGNYESIEVQIQKGAEIRTLTANDNQSGAATSPAPRGAPAPRTAANPASSAGASYAQRRSARQKALADLRKKQEDAQLAAPKYTPAEMQEHLQNYQMEVLRRGLPPLPVEISPEMENQLIDEGVLIVEPAE